VDAVNEKTRLYFVGGIHGVGKSYFCEQMVRENGINSYSASKLIADLKHEHFKTNKFIKDIGDNQNYLLKAVKTITDKEYLLDGHFCLLNSSGEVERVPIDIFKELPIAAIIVIYDDVSKVVKRINLRDGIMYSETTFEFFQNMELSYAKEIALLLNVPFACISCESDVMDKPEQIIKWLRNKNFF
jgi:adenylate kinase